MPLSKPYKNEFELINARTMMQCYFSAALNTQVIGFYIENVVGYITFNNTETEQGA
jgi:hypothetical protein